MIEEPSRVSEVQEDDSHASLTLSQRQETASSSEGPLC